MGNRLTRIVGQALVVLSLTFVAVLLWSQRETLAAFHPTWSDFAVLLVCALSYSLLNIMIGLAWRSILMWTGEVNISRREALRVFATAQVTKYLPGNVVQVGRQVVGRRAGWSHVGLLLSSVFELLVAMASAATVVLAGISLSGLHFQYLSTPALIIVLVVILATGIAVLNVLPAFIRKKWPDVGDRLASVSLIGLWFPFGIYIIFFLAGGCVLLVVAYAVVGSIDVHYWPIVGCLYAAAWLAGTFTPGAPAGIGIREAVLTVGMAGFIDPGSAVLIATLLRVVTVGGDVIAYLAVGRRSVRT